MWCNTFKFRTQEVGKRLAYHRAFATNDYWNCHLGLLIENLRSFSALCNVQKDNVLIDVF